MKAFTFGSMAVGIEEAFPIDALGVDVVLPSPPPPGPYIVVRIPEDIAVPGTVPVFVMPLTKGTACTMQGAASMVHDLGHTIKAGDVPAHELPLARQTAAAALAIVAYLATCVKDEMENAQ